ncbi:MAG: DUF5018 domain-containing protein [Bacteroidales bacterium]|nr:DUF5018 domain-containing protein [Bacteroidales bacterium]
MKNKIISLIAIASIVFGGFGCQEVEDLTPSISRSGINGITASFYGDESSENAFTSEIDSINGIITVVFPYNYPRTSDNVLTMSDLTKMRVTANLDDNVTISPAILYMDFTKENHLIVTDQTKKKKGYDVVAEIRKSAECAITNFELAPLGLNGVIDEANKKISLISIDPIGSALATVTVSHGAIMSPDPTTTALNYNDGVQITVTAQNGTNSAVYTVKKVVPSKIDLGMRIGSAKILWSKKLNTDLGITTLNMTGGMAVTKDYVVLNTRGLNSIYLDRKTGEKVGEIDLGTNKGSLINFYNTCDDGDNILLCNLASASSAFKVWRINGVTGTPQLYIQWNGGLTMGRKLSIKGSLDGNAIITVPINAAGYQFARWQVINGNLQSQTPTIITISGIYTKTWNYNCDIVYTNPTNLNSDYFVSSYAEPYMFTWVDGTTNIFKTTAKAISSNYIQNATDYTVFNNCPYTVSNSVNSAASGSADVIYLYDVSSSSGLATAVWQNLPDLYGGKGNGGTNGNGSGDVALKVSDDGYYMYLYFMFTNGCVVCVQYDCISM